MAALDPSRPIADRPLAGAPAPGWLGTHAGWLLFVLFLAALPWRPHYHVAVMLMAAAGVWLAIRGRNDLRAMPGLLPFAVLFASLWIPMIVSLPDAVNFDRSAWTTLKYLRFLGVGLFALWALRTEVSHRALAVAVPVLLTLWVLDAALQYFTGSNVLGDPRGEWRVQGLFYPRGRLGVVLATLLPFYFEGLRALGRRWRYSWLLAIPYLATILVNGSRTGWLMMGVALTGYLVVLLATSRSPVLTRANLAKAAAGLALAAVAATQFSGFTSRFEEALGVFSTEPEAIDRATMRRLSIWAPAARMARDHWVNGIGPRGYRYAFSAYADPDNFWKHDVAGGATHPHHQWLEIATETGVVGIAGFAVFLFTAFRIVFSLPPPRRRTVYPCLLSVVVAVSPLNVHSAFYGSFWSSVLWWLVALLVATYARERSAASDGGAVPSPSGGRSP